MSSSKTTFLQSFKDDFSISLGFSAFGVFGAIRNLDSESLGTKILAGTVFCLVSSTLFSAALASAQTWVIPKTKVPSFVLAVVLTALTYLAVILVALPLSIGLFVAYAAKRPLLSPEVIALVGTLLRPQIILGAFVLMVSITFFFMVKKKLGPGVLENWILGKYYRPREERRIFMFLDLRNSTGLGEELGDMAFSRLIQKFFADLSGPILKSSGEVSHYIGDEAVLTWKVEKGLKNANCLRFFRLMTEAVDANKADYMDEFGVVPEFKAGAHIGSVVATQVGDVKSEIVFHGDVLNTTSRIQSMCNELGADFLVSRELADAFATTTEFVLNSVGHHSLKGKGQDVELVRVDWPREESHSL